MYDILIKILIVAYACDGIITVIGYIPTIKDLLHHKKMSVNIKSYVIWTLGSGIAFLYSLFILKDLLFRIVSGLSFVCCAIILLLSLALSRANKKHKK